MDICKILNDLASTYPDRADDIANKIKSLSEGARIHDGKPPYFLMLAIGWDCDDQKDPNSILVDSTVLIECPPGLNEPVFDIIEEIIHTALSTKNAIQEEGDAE